MDEYCDKIRQNATIAHQHPQCRKHFGNTLKYCIDVIQTSRLPKTFWKQAKIARNQQEELLPIKQNLTECYNLIFSSVNDYEVLIDDYNILEFWNGIYIVVLVSIFLVLMVLLFMVYIYPKYRVMYDIETGKLVIFRAFKDIDVPSKPLSSAAVFEQRLKSMVRVMKHEVTRLNMKHVLTPNELITPDGSAVLVLRTSSLVDTLCGVVSGRYQCKGRFYRTVQASQKQQDLYKVETVERAVKFVNSFDRKLHIVLLFDDEPMRQLQDNTGGSTGMNMSDMAVNRKNTTRELNGSFTGIRRFSFEGNGDTDNENIEKAQETRKKTIPKSRSFNMATKDSRVDNQHRPIRKSSSFSSSTRLTRPISKTK